MLKIVVMSERRQITGSVQICNCQLNRPLSLGMWCQPAGSLANGIIAGCSISRTQGQQ